MKKIDIKKSITGNFAAAAAVRPVSTLHHRLSFKLYGEHQDHENTQ